MSLSLLNTILYSNGIVNGAFMLGSLVANVFALGKYDLGSRVNNAPASWALNILAILLWGGANCSARIANLAYVPLGIFVWGTLVYNIFLLFSSDSCCPFGEDENECCCSCDGRRRRRRDPDGGDDNDYDTDDGLEFEDNAPGPRVPGGNQAGYQ